MLDRSASDVPFSADPAAPGPCWGALVDEIGRRVGVWVRDTRGEKFLVLASEIRPDGEVMSGGWMRGARLQDY